MQKTIAFGRYPEIGLADARRLHKVAREHLTKGSDPNFFRKAEKKSAIIEANGTFRKIVNDWLSEKKGTI